MNSRVAMPRHAIADDVAIEQAQRREQGRGAIAFVVGRHGPTAALLQRKPRLGAIESLDLAFLIDGEHQGLVRGIEVEPDHVIERLDKLLEHGQGPLRIRVDPDRDLHLMEAVRVLGDLQALALIAHGIVVGDDAVFLDIEPIGEARSPPRHKGRPGFGGRAPQRAGYRLEESVRPDTGWPPPSP